MCRRLRLEVQPPWLGLCENHCGRDKLSPGISASVDDIIMEPPAAHLLARGRQRAAEENEANAEKGAAERQS